MVRKLVICTGSRADYGVLKPLLRLARESSVFELRLVAAGMHLSRRHGETWREIEADGYQTAARVKMTSGNPRATTIGLGQGVAGFSGVFEQVNPALVMVEGDRVEALAAALAAAYMGIPILHDGGGVLSRTIDNAARHAISHFATLHTVELEEARDRLIRYGCDPAAIHVVGALGIDAIRLMEWRSRAETLADLGLPPGSRYLLVTFHPESEHPEMAGEWMQNILQAVRSIGPAVVVTYPNSDPGSAAIVQTIERFLAAPPAGSPPMPLLAFPSLGSTRYLHAMKYADAVVGNSSSGLIEAPTLKVPVVNVGHRQDGRPKAANVIDCGYEAGNIATALDLALSDAMRSVLPTVTSAYGDGHAAERILAVIERRLGE